jgi:predicted dehydrogenase
MTHTNSRIRFGVIGAGRIGAHHARILGRHPGVELVGVCDTNMWRAQLAAWRGGGLAVRSYTDLLKKVDAVVVAVPTEHHAEVGLAALGSGVHCLIEKPIAGTMEDAWRLLDASERNKVQLQVGHVERFNPAVLKSIEYIKHPRFIAVERLGPYDSRTQNIGVVLDLMIHDLDILLTLVGGEVESLEAIGAHLFSKHEDIANVRVRFKSGCVADLTASRISIKRHRKIRIFQETSYISLDYMNATLQVYKKKRPNAHSLKDIEQITPKLDKTEPLLKQVDHFIDCVRHNRKPWPSGEHGIEALKLALQITDELERYEVTDHARPSTFLPRLAAGVGRFARTVTDTLRGIERDG